jgi:hypothetical protein
MMARTLDGTGNQRTYTVAPIPSNKFECVFYFALLYSLTADVLGVSAPGLAGVLVLSVFGLCLLQLRSYAMSVCKPIALLIACAVSFLLVQYVMHGASILDETMRAFLIWMLQLIIVHSLCLRQRFSFRYPLVLFALAVATLPFLVFNPGEIERAHVDTELGVQGGLSHPGGLSEWFGFFAVYFAILGLQAKRFTYRLCAWVATAGSLFVIALTVSRGPIFAAGLAITFGFRGLLKRGFAPVFVLIMLAGIGYESGLFEHAFSAYEERSTEDSGREKLWPAAVERIFESPETIFIGVGLSKAGLDALSARKTVTPHNSFLYFTLSSGLVPAALFIAFWIQAAWRSLHAKEEQESDAFRFPYLIYSFVAVMLGDLGFMSPWALLTLSVGAGSALVYGKQSLVLVRVGNKTRFALFPGHRSPKKGQVA